LNKHKIRKGHYGYRDAHKKAQIRNVSIFAVVIAAILIGRFFVTWEDMKKMMMITAILLVLPMANLASPMLVSWKFKTAPKELYDAVKPYEQKFTVFYDLIITNTDLIMPIDVAVIHPTGLYLFCPDKKVDIKKAEKFINEILIGWKLDGNAKIMVEKKNYLNRLASLRDLTEEDDDGSTEYITKVILGLSM
jgi:hypothetical protein